MELANGTNTISDARYNAAKEDMRDRHDDEYEVVHNGSGRSEELPEQLHDRQAREGRQLQDDRKHLSIAEWLKRYPDTARTHELIAERAETQEQALAGLSDKELLRALETAVRTGDRGVDLDAVKAEIRAENRQAGPWERTLPAIKPPVNLTLTNQEVTALRNLIRLGEAKAYETNNPNVSLLPQHVARPVAENITREMVRTIQEKIADAQLRSQSQTENLDQAPRQAQQHQRGWSR